MFIIYLKKFTFNTSSKLKTNKYLAVLNHDALMFYFSDDVLIKKCEPYKINDSSHNTCLNI